MMGLMRRKGERTLHVSIRQNGDEAETKLFASGSAGIARSTQSYAIVIHPAINDDIFESGDGSMTVLVHGELFNDLARPAKFVYEHFDGDIKSLANILNGTFVIVVVDRTRDFIHVITDRVNGRRLFEQTLDNKTVFSTSLELFSSSSKRLDLVGVAWYLANGTVHNGRTVYSDICVVDRASVISFSSRGCHQDQYWQINFDSDTSLSVTELQEALAHLIKQAVHRQVQDEPDIFLSLSGGYDASAIGGSLRYDLEYDRVTCFSYAVGEARPGTDEHRAREMADVMGYSHELIQAYDGNFIKHLRLNGALSDAFANPCDELSAYSDLSQGFSQVIKPVFFTGSEWFGDDTMSWSPLRLDQPVDVLQSTGMYDFSRIRWTQQLLPSSVYGEMHGGLKEDYEEVWRRCPIKEDLYDAKDYVYLDQRLVNHNMPWWLCYAGQFAPVRNPLLDRDILEFMTSVPTALRRDKKLWRTTATEAYPALFRLPRTRRGSYQFDLDREFLRHKDAVADRINSSSSPLDELLAPDIALKMLDIVCGRQGADLSSKTRMINMAKKSIPPRLKHRVRSLWPPSAFVPEQEPAVVLRRMLVLREALRLHKQGGAPPGAWHDREVVR